MFARRHILLGSLALPLSSQAAWSAWQPNRPVTLVVPYPAGGGVDVLARLLARELGPMLGSSVVVENAPGASGAVGSRRVARAEPDGLTVLVTTNQTHATNISLLKDGGGYDPIKDFTVLGGVADLQHLLIVRKDLPVRSVAELVARAKDGPNLTCASTGIGSASHLTMELFKVKTGASVVHVPYRGAAPLLQDLVGGRVDIAFATVPTVLGQLRSGDLRALAVASPARSPQLPEIDTLARQGIREVEADAWIAVFGPGRLPPEIVTRLAEAIGDIVQRPEIREAVTSQGMLPHWRGPDQFATFQKLDIERWAGIIRAGKVAIE